MSDPEPPASDGQNEGIRSKNGGGSLSRLRTLLRLLRRPRGPRSSRETMDALIVHVRSDRRGIALGEKEFGGRDGQERSADWSAAVVGDIKDKHDVSEPPTLNERRDSSNTADARRPIETLEEQHGTQLRPVG